MRSFAYHALADVARAHSAPPGLGEVRRTNPVKVMSIRTPRPS